MNLKKMMMASALLMVACCMQAQTKVIAHRGFWKTPGSSQNSISSLLKADSIGCYGSEFDVWIAKDNKLVVNLIETFEYFSPFIQFPISLQAIRTRIYRKHIILNLRL